MEDTVRLKKESPIKKASWVSKLMFLWTIKYAPKHTDKQYEIEDLPLCPDSVSSSSNGSRMKQIWNAEKKMARENSKNPSLLRVIFKTYMNEILIDGSLVFINYVVIKISQPIVLSELIKMFMEKNYTLRDISFYTGVMCFLLFSYSFLVYHIIFRHSLLALKMRVAVSTLVYEKVLRLSQKSLQRTTPGQIINVISNDVSRLDFFLPYHFLWIAPVQIIFVVVVLWTQFGVETLGGVVGLFVILVPLQCINGRFIGINARKAAEKTDVRMRIMNEIYFGIEVIKMYTWERPFKQILQEARKQELKYIKLGGYLKGLNISQKFFIEKVVLCITVLTFSYLGFPVLANTVFSLAVLLGMFQVSFGFMLPTATALGPELLISLKRVEDFLLLEETEEADKEIIEERELGTVFLEKVFASYGEDDASIVCDSVDIPQGTLCAVIGPVGSGKSSFLKLLLGELPESCGSIRTNGVISFSSQKPWLFSSTIRQNIVFDQEFDEVRYLETIRVCGLTRDLDELPSSDRTVVGSRGISLSGGQKARINLARAVYKKADVYLLDDVLSALDAKVGRHVFDECILKFLKGKTRIFVTHQLQYMEKVNHIIIFNKGALEDQGSLQKLSDGRNKLIELFPNSEESNEENVDEEAPSKSDKEEDKSLVCSMAELNLKNKNDGRENIHSGNSSTLWKYMKLSKSYFSIGIFIFMTLFGQFMMAMSDYWLTFWTEQEILRESTRTNGTLEENVKYTPVPFQHLLKWPVLSEWVYDIEVGNKHYLMLEIPILRIVYLVIIVTAVILCLFRTFVLVYICMKSCQNLHSKIFNSLIGAPMKFFSTNQPGYTLNIFSMDLGVIDSHMPRSLTNLFGVFSMMPGAMILICVTNYYMIVVMIVSIPIIFVMRRWFVSAMSTFSRIQAREKSHVYSYVSTTIDGINTIRASKSEKRLTTQFDEYQDIQSSAAYFVNSCNCAFGLWLEFLGNFVVLFVLVSFIILDHYVYISGSFIGLAIFQAMSLAGLLQLGFKLYSENLVYFTSAERVLDYSTQDTEEEPPNILENEHLKNWPSDGRINIQNLYMSYPNNAEPVLRNLNLEILPTEKVGIAGRTGAGKSSIISALFRLTPFEGTILIDGVDTKTIPLKTLREGLSIIPQQPVLFSASIRYNLDPLCKYTDQKIWKALEEVELKGIIKSLDDGVDEGGSNFSVGQKQLLCLARALLRKGKILILDEATANLDLRTDELIQSTIRKSFKDCTVLTVAHRLATIMDSDRVLVMDSGEMVEFDHPQYLLQNPRGRFYKLVEETNSRKKR